MRMSALRYSAEWKHNAPNVAPEERATVADFGLWLDGQNVAMHLRGSANFDHLTISLYPLAEGLTHDWWALFGGRDLEFSLIKHRSGYAVPDIRLKFDGSVFEVSAYQRTYENPGLRFWAGPTEIMSRGEAEAQLGSFVELVLDRLDGQGVRETTAALRWARVRASRADFDEARFCEAAGALRLDPYQIDDTNSGLIEKAASIFAGEPLNEFLSGARNARRAPLLEWIETVESRPRHAARIAELGAVAQQAALQAPARSLERSWSLGYRRARAVRRVMNLGPNGRFHSFSALARALGAGEHYALAGQIDGIRALRSDHHDGIDIHMRDHGNSSEAHASHLFSFARAVGDVTCFPERAKAPINDLHAAYRQAAGRAFAAEFLAPIDEIQAMQGDGRDIVSIAEEFAVSAAVIERQIENAGRIKAACN
jgi:hypothetical protein